MRITDQDAVNTISKSQATRVYDSAKAGFGGTSEAGSSGIGTSDRIDLGSQSDLVSLAQTAGDPSRAARLEQLRVLVQSGQYQVDPAALSQAIVQSTINGY